ESAATPCDAEHVAIVDMNTLPANYHNAALLQRLRNQRRTRLARSGGLGRTVKALHDLADLMDRDNVRTAANNRRDGRGRYPVGIPPNMGFNLIRQACSGTQGEFNAEWIRLAREVSLETATRWGDEQADFTRSIAAIVYPAGLASPTVSADEVRALAEQHAADAQPVADPPKAASRLTTIPAPSRPRQTPVSSGLRSTATLQLPSGS
ncbi:hypothetical protein, partial [Streptomyces sp. NPDC127040]|uniref:hypothetical protein n=1 Tax=Streptomyces sp. NPDC127040 TaxID=3347116 RepID=UPI00364E36BD